MEQCVVDGEDQVGHHLPQQDGTLVILPVAETHGDQCAEPDELVKYVHPSFLLIKNAAHPVGCVAKNGSDAPEKSTLILEFYYTMGQPHLSIAAKDNLQKPWAFGASVVARRFCFFNVSTLNLELPQAKEQNAFLIVERKN